MSLTRKIMSVFCILWVLFFTSKMSTVSIVSLSYLPSMKRDEFDRKMFMPQTANELRENNRSRMLAACVYLVKDIFSQQNRVQVGAQLIPHAPGHSWQQPMRSRTVPCKIRWYILWISNFQNIYIPQIAPPPGHSYKKKIIIISRILPCEIRWYILLWRGNSKY